MRRRWRSWIVLTLGVGAILAGLYGLLTTGAHGASVVQAGVVPYGSVAASAGGSSTPSSRATGTHQTASRPTPSRPTPSQRTTSHRTTKTLWAGRPLPGPPIHLSMPALGIEASVIPVRVLTEGAVAVPPDVGRLGWVATSGRPGDDRGTATVVGHVDDAHGDIGVAHRLYGARVGQFVDVSTATGETLPYVVKAVRLYSRTRLPPDVFSADGRPRLALVTCAGVYDRSLGGYQQNLVVWAVPRT